MINSYSTSSVSSESKRSETNQNHYAAEKPLITCKQDRPQFPVFAREEFGRGDSFIFSDETTRNKDYLYGVMDENDREENANILIELIKREKYRNVKVGTSCPVVFHLATFLQKLIVIPHVTSLSLLNVKIPSTSLSTLIQGTFKEIELINEGSADEKENFLIGLLKNRSVTKLSVDCYPWTEKVAEAVAANSTLVELFVSQLGSMAANTEPLFKGIASNKSILTFSIEMYFGIECANLLALNPTLTHLNVDGCGLDEGSLLVLSKIPNIQRLNLGRNRNITLQVGAALASCPSLTYLGYGYAQNESKNDCLKALMKSKSIHSLSLNSANLDMQEVMALAQNESLTFLELSSSLLNRESLVALAMSRSIQQLMISTSEIQSGSATQTLAANTVLIQLHLYAWLRRFSEEQLLDLALSENIQLLCLKGSNQVSEITEKVAKAFAQNRALTMLDLSGFTASEKSMLALAESQTIHDLRMDGIKLTKAVAKALAENKVLMRFTLPDRDLEEGAVEALVKNNNIVDLRILDSCYCYTALENAPMKIPYVLETKVLKNNITLHAWKRGSILLASCRANLDSLIKDSILSLLKMGDLNYFLQEEYSSYRFFNIPRAPGVRNDQPRKENASVLRA